MSQTTNPKYFKRFFLAGMAILLLPNTLLASEVVVFYEDEIIHEIVDSLAPQGGSLQVVEKLPKQNIALIKSEDMSNEEMISLISSDDAVRSVEVNRTRTRHIIPSDISFGEQWALHNTGQVVGGVTGSSDADSDFPEMWDIENPHAQSVVAVLDDGIDYDTADLALNTWDGSPGCIKWDGTIIGGGCIHGYNFDDESVDPIGFDHGSHVGSIIGANTDDALGMSGSSLYGSNKVMGLKFDLTLFEEFRAITFANLNGARVINMSFGGPWPSQIEEELIAAFDGIVVASSGNSGLNLNSSSRKEYPCAYELDNIICVGASTNTDLRASFSNFGTDYVDIMAPGDDILGYSFTIPSLADGTSFSAPYVAAVVGSLYGHNTHLTPVQVRNLLLDSTDSIAQFDLLVSSGGRLNAHTALSNLISTYGERLDPYRAHGLTGEDLVFADGGYTFTLSTNKSATCRYSDSPGTLYASMSAMNASGGTAHYHKRTDLVPETAYVIYVRCQDAFGNTNTDDYIISFVTQSDNPLDVYRFYSDVYRSHFYTTNLTERNVIINTNPNWTYEGIAYTLRTPGVSSSMLPIYRFYSDNYNSHFYTISEAEKDDLSANIPNWAYEGISYYAYSHYSPLYAPIYRFYSNDYNSHFYTSSAAEAQDIIDFDSNWSYEGIAYYID